MKHLPTFRIPSTPPGVGGWSRDYWYLGEISKYYWYLRSQKSVFGPAEGRKFLEIWDSKYNQKRCFLMENYIHRAPNIKKSACGGQQFRMHITTWFNCASDTNNIMSQIQIPEIVLVSILFVNTSILVYTIVGGCENVLKR